MGEKDGILVVRAGWDPSEQEITADCGCNPEGCRFLQGRLCLAGEVPSGVSALPDDRRNRRLPVVDQVSAAVIASHETAKFRVTLGGQRRVEEVPFCRSQRGLMGWKRR